MRPLKIGLVNPIAHSGSQGWSMTRLGAYKLSWMLAKRLPPLARSAHSRLWLHVLRSSDLIDLTVASYGGQSGFESEEHNSAGLWSWERAVIEEYFCGCSKILVAAAGAGREMIPLFEAGFTVTGFDVSADLVEAGRRNLAKAGVLGELQLAPACSVPHDLELQDALIVGRGAYHHIPDRLRRVGFLEACRMKLRQNAPILIGDFLTRSSARVGRRGAREIGDGLNSSFFHYFNEEEIRSEMDAAGFDLIDFRPTPFLGGGNTAHAIGRAR
jgi:hypothetical protein